MRREICKKRKRNDIYRGHDTYINTDSTHIQAAINLSNFLLPSHLTSVHIVESSVRHLELPGFMQELVITFDLIFI
jgi:hypothetical protein